MTFNFVPPILRSRFSSLSLALLVACAAAGCKRAEQPAPPASPAPASQKAPAPAVPQRTRQQAMDQVLELPEIKAWSEQIEQKSHGAAHGAVIEDDPAPRLIGGKPYYQLSFVENRKRDVHRRASFLVAREGDEILVDSLDDDSVQSLSEWRRNIRNVELKAN